MASISLTNHLTSKYPDLLASATTHPFLTQVGQGTLPSTLLCEWLVQDKYYEIAYVKFIGRLISKVNLVAFSADDREREKLEWNTLEALIAALQAIKDEIAFYDGVVQEYELPLVNEGESETTVKYRELFEESSAEGKPLLWGLTVLWGTEYVYLRAWSHAKEHQKDMSSSGNDATAALHKEFIPNWTSHDFKAAVQTLADVTNAWATGLEKGEKANSERLWYRVLELEKDFWPRPE